jgi:hypothetical protein
LAAKVVKKKQLMKKKREIFVKKELFTLIMVSIEQINKTGGLNGSPVIKSFEYL